MWSGKMVLLSFHLLILLLLIQQSVDVKGSVSQKIPTVSLIPVNNVLDEDFWPEDFVIEKGKINGKLGIVKRINAQERTAQVLWLREKGKENESKKEETPEGEASLGTLESDIPVFALSSHPDYSYQLSDVVVLLTRPSASTPGKALVGQILQIQNGQLKVCWGDRSISWVSPEEIYHISRDDEQEEPEYFTDYEDYSDEEGEEGETEGEYSTEEAEYGEYAAPNVPGIGPSQSPWWQDSEAAMNATLKAMENIRLEKEAEENQRREETKTQEKNNNTEAPPKAKKENGVYVRISEERLDLLKVLIQGPPDTPYEGAVFLFDVHIPGDYPASPPELHYLSYAPKLNPNLYEDGRVCLSLLGTWSGKGTENWSPSSNILQVVISIQGLILGASKPFFLEAGYDKLKGTSQGEHQAKLYNESAFLLALQSIPSLLARLPAPFEDLIIKHFLVNGGELLEKCKDYINHPEEKEGRFIEKPSTGFLKSLEKIFPKVEETLGKLQERTEKEEKEEKSANAQEEKKE